ncbi:MAG: methionyl-tRNA formyltransferase [Candidatus Zambryskibacteria bacterium RIFOXYC1_FULL_39_10]|uniref:methionyl-tRNA formyltransferase n=1 Tax=Candidatus Zambryskibacteria bacterium RIFOXYC1_FULL_39_10 TaxID=1802779 RepID=A0A1G2UYT7_9BACT|nr:MAG: methionyl-tRNA formyltransferase [Candidatus Zambryskibacteria bacterium RIFOXYC1_FULL_39_10]OHB15441.1 MAG: methionyl-tRNA formyltransferase [Candidatus Zambryskibacteria bacterium RIFOXYD1_FULL_39_35]
MKMVFFGSSEFSVYVLDELKLHNILPVIVVTTPDKPKGRKLVMTGTPVKIWAQENNIEVLDPSSLKNNPSLISNLISLNSDLFLVASYGKIIPKEIFEIPERKTLNIHPSLLPKYRGASPIQSQILSDEKEIGVTIMQIEETMDTGPVIVQKTSPLTPLLDLGEGKHSSYDKISSVSSLLPSPDQGEGGRRPGGVLGRKELEKILAIEGARLFAHILPEWLMGAIDPIMQDESKATYCQKIKKEDGELQIDLDNMPTGEIALKYLCKIKAFEEWPTTYFFLNGKRIIITDATIEDGNLKILRVIPEGKKEMFFEDFKRGIK